MFQTFQVIARPEQGPPRLEALRAAMATAGMAAFVVPHDDAFQGEYVAPRDERLAWLTGFTGSAGFAAVTAQDAGVFVDGRYRVQVREQVAETFTPVHWPETTLADWLCARLVAGDGVGFDPWLHTVRAVDDLDGKLSAKGIALTPVANPVDALWDDRPDPPAAPMRAQGDDLTGQSHADKRAQLAAGLRDKGHRAVVLTASDSIAWLTNTRGGDIARNPVTQAYAILHDDGRLDLFVGTGKADGIAGHLGNAVSVHDIGDFADALTMLKGPVAIDPAKVAQAIADTLAQAGVEMAHAVDPCALPKARKTDAEIAGAREAHLRDGAVMAEFLAWIDAEAPKGHLTETAVVTRLEEMRAATGALKDISFETIAGAGPHAALPHYRVTEESDRGVRLDELLLVDSGGQYADGTTDVTRTICVGAPPADAVECYTAVLRGMIAISMARFPRGVGGAHLDALARQYLWAMGRDYDHGTGHGVGAYLCVHEGPQSLSRKSDLAFAPGMILSNEPGYYREGAFGIRIENLLVVRAAPAIAGGDDRDMLAFETLTWVPLDRRLIDAGALVRAERDWIDGYHADTLAKIGPRVGAHVLDWLTAACAPL